MALDADTLLDRMHLKSQLSRWRSVAIIALALSAILAFAKLSGLSTAVSDHIARVTIQDIIVDDLKRDKMFRELAQDDLVKAVIIQIDTPGGTALGGEELYRSIKALSKAKPTVILMRTMCTSAGYMAALGGSHLIAREGTITGSIGVIMQSFEATELAKKIGVNPIVVKSGEYKATPNFAEKFDDKQRAYIQTIINDFFRFFVELVVENRPLDESQVRTLADGRIFTGSQALKEKLIDELGGQEEALAWLNKTHQIDPELEIKDVEPEQELDSIFSKLQENMGQAIFSYKNMLLPLDGLLLIWQPALTQ